MDYEINDFTLAVFPIAKEKCKVIEQNSTYLLDCNSYQVIVHSCEYFGSTLQGRQKGTKSLIGVTHKQPLIIEESRNIIFFPLTSPLNLECAWISFNNILNYSVGNSKNSSIIYFKSGEKLEVPISIGSLTNQILRSSRLQVVLNDRINKNK